MNPRERTLLFTFLALVGVVSVGIIFNQWFLKPLREANTKIEDLENDIAQKDQQIRFVKLEQKRLEKYQVLSLPGNPDQAASDYAKYLKPLLRSCGLTVDDLQGPPPASLKPVATQGKKAGHIPLTFTLSARGTMASLVKTLATLKHTPIAHRVKSLSLSPADGSGKDAGKLNIQMAVEALIVHKADNIHPLLSAIDTRLLMLENVAALRGAPVGLALGPWLAASRESLKTMVAKEEALARNYFDIPKRNVFVGALPAPEPDVPVVEEFDVRDYIYLIHTDPVMGEAYLHNRIFKSRDLRLKSKKGSGYDIFRIINEDTERVVMKGKVLRVDQRDVYFQVVEDIYGIHIGQSLAEAMRKPLYPDETEMLGLDPLWDAAYAEQELKATAAGKGKNDGKNKGPNNKGKGPDLKNMFKMMKKPN